VMKKETMRELLKRSPDRADALCLTFYEHRSLFSQCADSEPLPDGFRYASPDEQQGVGKSLFSTCAEEFNEEDIIV